MQIIQSHFEVLACYYIVKEDPRPGMVGRDGQSEKSLLLMQKHRQ